MSGQKHMVAVPPSLATPGEEDEKVAVRRIVFGFRDMLTPDLELARLFVVDDVNGRPAIVHTFEADNVAAANAFEALVTEKMAQPDVVRAVVAYLDAYAAGAKLFRNGGGVDGPEAAAFASARADVAKLRRAWLGLVGL